MDLMIWHDECEGFQPNYGIHGGHTAILLYFDSYISSLGEYEINVGILHGNSGRRVRIDSVERNVPEEIHGDKILKYFGSTGGFYY